MALPPISASASSGASGGDSAQKSTVSFGQVNFKGSAKDNRTQSAGFDDPTAAPAPAGVPLWVWIGGGVIAAGVAVYFITRRAS